MVILCEIFKLGYGGLAYGRWNNSSMQFYLVNSRKGLFTFVLKNDS